MKKLAYKGILALLWLTSFIVPALINAQPTQPGGFIPQPPQQGGIFQPGPIRLPNPLKFDTITELLDAIANAMLWIDIPIISIMIIIGAYQILFSAGNEEKFKTGKRTILYAVIGAAIIALAKGTTDLINQLLK